MSAQGGITPAGRGRCPARAREVAARLSELFTRDVEIVKRLNDAHGRLARANERLWSACHPVVCGLVEDGASTVAVEALRQIHSSIHGAFVDYQRACEERRQLAVDVGEFAQQLSDVLCAAGWSEREARRVDVHELAGADGDDRLGRFTDLGVETGTG